MTQGKGHTGSRAPNSHETKRRRRKKGLLFLGDDHFLLVGGTSDHTGIANTIDTTTRQATKIRFFLYVFF